MNEQRNDIGVGIGDKVYRALDVKTVDGEPKYTVLGGNEFPKTENSWVIRIFDSALLSDMRLVTFDGAESGVIGFCDFPIPEDWVYFVVVGISKKSKCVFVRPVAGDPDNLVAKEMEAYDQRARTSS